MKARTHINLHFDDDTVCQTFEGSRFVCVDIADTLTLFFDCENQIHELIGALEAASGHLLELVNRA